MVPVSSIQTSWSNLIFWSVLSWTREIGPSCWQETALSAPKTIMAERRGNKHPSQMWAKRVFTALSPNWIHYTSSISNNEACVWCKWWKFWQLTQDKHSRSLEKENYLWPVWFKWVVRSKSSHRFISKLIFSNHFFHTFPSIFVTAHLLPNRGLGHRSAGHSGPLWMEEQAKPWTLQTAD